MMLQLIDKQSRFFFYILLFIFLTTINHKSQIFEKNSFMNINHIVVNGLAHDKNIEIYNDLKTLLYKNILLVKKDTFFETFKDNNLIESYVVKKKYPNSIYVDIQKTESLALTILNNKKFFIGSNGKLIKYEENILSVQKLPFVFGKFSNLDFVKFKKNIDASNFNYKDIDSISYFINKRWDIKTKNGILIKLPGFNVTNSLNLANKIMKDKQFNKKKVIDLRISKQIILSNE